MLILSEIFRRFQQNVCIVSEQSNASIATLAQQPSDHVREMAVIDVEPFAPRTRLIGIANSAAMILERKPFAVTVGGQPILSQLASAVNVGITH